MVGKQTVLPCFEVSILPGYQVHWQLTPQICQESCPTRCSYTTGSICTSSSFSSTVCSHLAFQNLAVFHLKIQILLERSQTKLQNISTCCHHTRLSPVLSAEISGGQRRQQGKEGKQTNKNLFTVLPGISLTLEKSRISSCFC